jgi:hypothetical protein
MKKFITILLSSFLINSSIEAQVIDRAPTGIKNILSVEGSGIEMEIDSITSLNELINRLNNDWRFNETGKGYWIGYTNDMFSIASHGEEAIPFLTNLFKTTQNKKGKIGALYTLHLIGINSKIIGRFEESFVNKKARIALLELLYDKKYCYQVIELLMRDPWKSDLPYLFEILQKETDTEVSWPIINSLSRYKVNELPINNDIPSSISDLSISLKVENENILERDFDFTTQIKQALKEYENKFPKLIKVEKEVYDEKLSQYYRTKLSSSLNVYSFLNSLGIQKNSVFNYCQIGSKIQYYIQNDILYFCSIKTAQNILTKWWTNLSAEKKRKFN